MEWDLSNLSGEVFYSIAAFFSCSAYILRNMLWLRILLVLASTLYIISGIRLGVNPMIGWNSAYLLINLIQITFLLLDRITISLPDDTKDIYREYFSYMSTREFKKLILTNQFCIYQNKSIVDEFDVLDRLYIVLRGKVDVIKSGQTIARLRPGNFIGEMSFLSKEQASAGAYARNFVQCAYWTHQDLENLKTTNLDVYNTFISILGCDLVRKLNVENQSRPGHSANVDFII